MIKLLNILKENLDGDYEYMLYSLYAGENKIKQLFPGSKITKIENGIKVKFSEPYYVNTLDNHPEDEDEGYGIFNSMIIKVNHLPAEYSKEDVYTYDIILPTGDTGEEHYNMESFTDLLNTNSLYNFLKDIHSVSEWLEKNKNK